MGWVDEGWVSVGRATVGLVSSVRDLLNLPVLASSALGAVGLGQRFVLRLPRLGSGWVAWAGWLRWMRWLGWVDLARWGLGLTGLGFWRARRGRLGWVGVAQVWLNGK